MSQYQCYVCKVVYDKQRTDEEALEELNELFPYNTVSDCDVVCDNCFKLLSPYPA